MAETALPYVVESFSATDGYRLHYRRYPARLPTGQDMPRAYLVCIHGIQSHAGWYTHSCTRWAEAGYEVYFLDRRGSGMNEQARGDTPSYRRLIDDVAEFLRSLRVVLPRDRQERVPIYLAAISWGGKLAAALPKKTPGNLDGLILITPGFFPRIMPSFSEKLRIVWSRLKAPTRLFPIPLDAPELFTAAREWQHFIAEDKLGLHQATARFMLESARLDRYIRTVSGSVTIPVLLLLAGDDRIIDNAKTRCFAGCFATPDTQIIEYAGAQHTLEFDAVADRYIGDVLNWLERHKEPRAH